MCSRPITRDGNTFACRSCNECIATRRHGWVARAMMEKALHPHTLCLALTYDDSTQANRDAARMFQYQDIRLFLDRVRKAANSPIRFICAGEQGDRNNRCHWHLIIYSQVDLTQLGTVQRIKDGKRVTVTDRADMLTQGSRKVRLNWSLWPHGFATFQEPDQGGMHYVLSYCLKDQFTEEKSRGTMREAKSENFATGLFRMSKRPAIGEAWLWQKWQKLEAEGAVMPNLNFKVPDLGGYYHPSGSFREKILWSLRALNERAKIATGRDAPQWQTLLANCQANPSDLELLHGPTQEHPDDRTTIDNDLAKRQREHAGRVARSEFARVCGNELPCEPCLSYLSDEKLAELGVVRTVEFGAYFFKAADGFDPVPIRQGRKGSGSNPYCGKRGSKISRHTFPDTDRIRLARADL